MFSDVLFRFGVDFATSKTSSNIFTFPNPSGLLRSRRSSANDEVVELRTVGIDIGSSTSHLVFSKIVLQREAELSSRFLVVERELISESPIALTPFLGSAQIDVAQLRTIVSEGRTRLRAWR